MFSRTDGVGRANSGGSWKDFGAFAEPLLLARLVRKEGRDGDLGEAVVTSSLNMQKELELGGTHNWTEKVYEVGEHRARAYIMRAVYRANFSRLS